MSAWSPNHVKDRKKSERVQRRFTILLSGLKGLEYGRIESMEV